MRGGELRSFYSAILSGAPVFFQFWAIIVFTLTSEAEMIWFKVKAFLESVPFFHIENKLFLTLDQSGNNWKTLVFTQV